jgi:hypothetical protein
MSKRVLIVGGGLSGAAVSRFVSICHDGPTVDITMWEALSYAGGRMHADRSHSGSSRCDMGAQYISRSINSSDDNSDVYDFLEDAGALKMLVQNAVIEGMRPDHLSGRHYIAPRGTDDVITSLLGAARVVCSRKLSCLLPGKLGKTRITAVSGCGVEEEFDAVVITTPTKEALSVLDSFRPVDVLPGKRLTLPVEVLRSMSSVNYSSRYGYCTDSIGNANTSCCFSFYRFALAVHYTLSTLEKQELFSSVPWRAKYILGDDVIRYVSIENFKHEVTTPDGGDGAAGTGSTHGEVSILVHTSVPYGISHMPLLQACAPGAGPITDQALLQQRDAVVAEILCSATRPGALPFLRRFVPSEVKLLGWEASQVPHTCSLKLTVVQSTGSRDDIRVGEPQFLRCWGNGRRNLNSAWCAGTRHRQR